MEQRRVTNKHFQVHRTRMSLNKFLQGYGHFFFHRAGGVHMARNVEELCARVSLASKTKKPSAAATADGRRHGHRLDVCNRRWTPEHTCDMSESSVDRYKQVHLRLCCTCTTYPRQQGREVSDGVCPVCPQWTRSEPSPLRRCTPQRRASRTRQSHNPSCTRSGRSARLRTPH